MHYRTCWVSSITWIILLCRRLSESEDIGRITRSSLVWTRTPAALFMFGIAEVNLTQTFTIQITHLGMKYGRTSKIRNLVYSVSIYTNRMFNNIFRIWLQNSGKTTAYRIALALRLSIVQLAADGVVKVGWQVVHSVLFCQTQVNDLPQRPRALSLPVTLRPATEQYCLSVDSVAEVFIV